MASLTMKLCVLVVLAAAAAKACDQCDPHLVKTLVEGYCVEDALAKLSDGDGHYAYWSLTAEYARYVTCVDVCVNSTCASFGESRVTFVLNDEEQSAYYVDSILKEESNCGHFLRVELYPYPLLTRLFIVKEFGGVYAVHICSDAPAYVHEHPEIAGKPLMACVGRKDASEADLAQCSEFLNTLLKSYGTEVYCLEPCSSCSVN